MLANRFESLRDKYMPATRLRCSVICRLRPKHPQQFLSLDRTRYDPALPARHAMHLRRRRRSTATSEAPTELRREFTWRSTLLGLCITHVASSVAALTITTITIATVSTWATASTGTLRSVVAAHHAARWCVAALLLDVRCWNDLGGQVQPFAEVVEAFRGES